MFRRYTTNETARRPVRGVFLFFLLFLLLALPRPAWALRVVLLSDTQGDKGPGYEFINTKETEAAVAVIVAMRPKPDMVFCLGDLAGRGFTAETGYQFDAFTALMRPLAAASIPLYVVKGNHELTRARLPGEPRSAHYFLENQEAFRQAFAAMPANGPKGYEHLAYTVSDAATKTVFVVLDSYYLEKDLGHTPYGAYGYISQAQLDWLRGPMPERDAAAHRILLTHAPAINPKKDPSGFVNESFQTLWECLEDKRFDLAIAAHLHIFSFARVDAALYPASRYPVAQAIIGPVGGTLSSKQKTAAVPEAWNAFSARNFLVLEIDGPQATAPIKLTPYVKTGAGGYAPSRGTFTVTKPGVPVR